MLSIGTFVHIGTVYDIHWSEPEIVESQAPSVSTSTGGSPVIFSSSRLP